MQTDSIDIFEGLLLFGEEAARYDWLNHVEGAATLLGRADSPLQPADAMAETVRHPHNYGLRLTVLGDDDEDEYAAYDEDGMDEPISLRPHDLSLFRLSPAHFGKWLRSLLKLPPKTAPQIQDAGRHIILRAGDTYIHFSLASTSAELKPHLESCSAQHHNALLLMSDWWQESSHANALIGEHPHIAPYSIQDFISPSKAGYAYCGASPFLELVKNPDPHIPNATFLARPPGFGWEHLHISIRTPAHHELINVEQDIVHAWFEDEKGKRVGSNKLVVGTYKKFCRNRQSTNMYRLLKSYALLRGTESSRHGMNAASANTERNRLRAHLREMFGFGEHEADPLTSVNAHKACFETAFSIGFSDSNSDPIAENRRNALAPPRTREGY